MEFLFNSYALTLLISSTVVLGLSFYIGFKLEDSVRWIAFTMMSFSLWGFFYGVELTQDSIDTMIFLTKLQYIGLVMAPACWVMFSLKYTGYENTSWRWIYFSLFIFPIVIYSIVLTNSWHHLHYKSNWLITSGPFPMLGIERGPMYFIQIVYSYFFYFLGTFILWRRFQFANKHFKLQTRLLILGGFFPLIINVLYQISWLKPYEGLDMTPYAFIFTYFLLGVAILRFNLLNLKPFARDKILEVLSRGVLVFDHRGKVVDYNSAVKSFCLRPEKIKMGVNAQSIFEERPEILELLKLSEQKSIESRVVSPNGELIIKIESIPILEGGPLVSGVLLLFDDITSEIKINERLQNQATELQHLNNLKDKFFSIISHDLKGPVFGVKELIYLTQTGVISKDEFYSMLPEVSKNMEQVSILLENLLAWTSSQLKGEYIQPQKIDLYRIVSSQKNLLERIASEKSVLIEMLGFENTWVKADKNMVELIFRNLISNAIKFSKKNSKIILTCAIEGDDYEICVRDFGAGISPENLEKLNEGISFTTRGQNNETGTGLGMLLVKEYLDKNGGTLRIESTLGEGSKFYVKLPIWKAN
ncbi:MAG: ATP-binding protein [Algoriphagus sp.]|nr:ATP-binding protein [Algoriphagus sp.]